MARGVVYGAQSLRLIQTQSYLGLNERDERVILLFHEPSLGKFGCLILDVGVGAFF